MDDIIRAASLWGFDALITSLGHTSGPLLREAGLTEADLDDPDRYIPRARVVDLLEITAWKLKRPDIGLRLASLQDVNILGALAFAIRNAATLRGAIHAASKHLHYHAPVPRVLLRRCSDHPEAEEIVFDERFASAPSALQMSEHTVALACRIVRHLSGVTVRPVSIKFAHQAMSPPAVYSAYLPRPATFSAGVNAIAFKTSDLNSSMKTMDWRLHAIVERYLDTNSPPAAHIERRVYEALTQAVRAAQGTTIVDISDRLRVPVRALQRELQAAGTTFEHLRDDARRHLAALYLGDNIMPPAHIAALLGFATAGSFERNCRRWFGDAYSAKRKTAPAPVD